MMKLLLIVFVFALNACTTDSATRTRARHLSVEADGESGDAPKPVKRNRAGREIDRSFLVDMFDPDPSDYGYMSMSMSMSMTDAPSPFPSVEMTDAPTPAPSSAPTKSTKAPTSKSTKVPTMKSSKAPTMAPSPAPSPAPSQETDSPFSQPTQGEICHCAPNSYGFTLDFSLTCPPVNVATGGGVASTACVISPFGDDSVDDLIPVSVQTIDILELDQNLQVIAQENIAGSFEDGDTFQYTSIAATPGSISITEPRPTTIPRAIQLNIIGVNQNDESIVNVFVIAFTNSCDFYPVLSKGDSAGWTVFTNLGAPDPLFCPLAPIPTLSPTSEPSLPPSKAPSPLPTLLPSAAPSVSLAPTCGKGGCSDKSTKAPSSSNDNNTRRKTRAKRHLVRGNEA